MSISEALETTIKLLSNIQIPAGLIDQVGIPLSAGINNLIHIRAGIEEAIENQKKQEEDADAEV